MATTAEEQIETKEVNSIMTCDMKDDNNDKIANGPVVTVDEKKEEKEVDSSAEVAKSEDVEKEKAGSTATAADEKQEEAKVPNAEVPDEKDNDEVVQAVVERLKFFFSDANVRQDQFMKRHLMPHDKNYYDYNSNKPLGDGFVPVEALARFNTIKKITTDEAVIINAAKALPHLLVVKEDNKGIGRVDPFTRDKMSGNIPLTLVVRNIPINAPDEGSKGYARYQVTNEQVRDLFTCYGNVAFVKLRFKYEDKDSSDDGKSNTPGKKRNNNKRGTPDGTAMVEFDTEEVTQKAAEDVLTSREGVEVEPKRKLTLGGNTLKVITLKDYIEEKRKLKKEVKESAETEGEGKQQGRESSKKRQRDDDESKNDNEDDEEEGEECHIKWVPGCVIELKGLAAATCDRETILKSVADALSLTVEELQNAKKAYIDYCRGQTDGAIRFSEPTPVIHDVVKKLTSGEVTIAGAKVEAARILQGDEEVQYWKKFAEFKRKQKQHKMEEKHHHHYHGKWKKGGRGGGGGFKKRR